MLRRGVVPRADRDSGHVDGRHPDPHIDRDVRAARRARSNRDRDVGRRDPVVACDLKGRPIRESNLGRSIGRGGLRAPGDGITSLGARGEPVTLGGTSVAAPFVTGAIALVWSEFPTATAAEVKAAVTQSFIRRRATVTPPLLDAWAAYALMALARRDMS